MNNQTEICSVNAINTELVKKIQKKIKSSDEISEIADFFKVLGDSTRVKILLALKETELCVCDIASISNVSLSAISHQLRLLKNKRVVKSRREGKMVYYSICDDHISQIISDAGNHINE